MSYVFINYAKQDGGFVNRFVADLKHTGIATWFDMDDLRPGINFVDGLGKAIADADAMIIVVSKHSVQSQWVILEFEFARKNKILVVPLVIDEAEPQTLSEYMRAFQIIDARKNYDLALKAIVAVLPDSVKHVNPLSSHAPGAKGYVFLSYANPDAPLVDQLKPYLRTRNYAYWDYRDTDRDYQSLLAVELERAIMSARATLCILSPNWRTSEWTLNEYEYSTQVGKPTLLLKMKAFEPVLRIAAKTYIDFTQGFDHGAELLDRELRRYNLL